MSSTHSPPAARSSLLDARNSQSPSNAHTNSTLTQTQPQIIGSPQQLLHPRRGRSQLQPTSTSGDSSQPTAPNQPGSQPPSSDANNIVLEIPSTWLDEQDRYICHICLQLVSNRRQSSHSKKCNAGGVASSVPDFAGPLPPNPVEELLNQHELGLPSFEDVCLLNQPTLHFVLSKSRPAFARALSSALRCVILENTEEAWLKLFMLPKCVLPSLRRKGRHDKPLPVDILCNMWSDNKGDLWDLARNRMTNHKRGACSTSINQRTKVIDQAVSLGRSGMWVKACRILQSSGIAPNNDITWQLLKSKHPSCPTPVPPVVHTTPVSLEPDFNIIAILRSFPKDTAAGPSGLRVQHLLDVISIPLHTPICPSLRQVINTHSRKSPYLSVTFLGWSQSYCPQQNQGGLPTRY
ncbi:hypothetical protein EMCRGX_G023154 [Ephydatia muelleri]